MARNKGSNGGRRPRRKSVILRIMVLLVSIYMTATLINLWNTLNEDKAQLELLNRKKSEQQADIAELRALLEEGSQSQIIEKAARERLGYVYSDEEIYIDISGK